MLCKIRRKREITFLGGWKSRVQDSSSHVAHAWEVGSTCFLGLRACMQNLKYSSKCPFLFLYLFFFIITVMAINNGH